MAVCCFLLFFSESKSQLLCRRIFRRASSFQRKFSIGSILCSTWIISVAQFSIRLVFQTATSSRGTFSGAVLFCGTFGLFSQKSVSKISWGKDFDEFVFFRRKSSIGTVFRGEDFPWVYIQRGSYPEGIVSAGQFLSSYQTHIMKLSEKKDKSFGLHYEHFTRS